MQRTRPARGWICVFGLRKDTPLDR